MSKWNDVYDLQLPLWNNFSSLWIWRVNFQQQEVIINHLIWFPVQMDINKIVRSANKKKLKIKTNHFRFISFFLFSLKLDVWYTVSISYSALPSNSIFLTISQLEFTIFLKLSSYDKPTYDSTICNMKHRASGFLRIMWQPK